MTGLNHVLTGSAIGLAVRRPLLVAPLALLSHFAIDMLPHFGGVGNLVTIAVIDTCISAIVVAIITLKAPKQAGAVLLGAFFAFLPDVFWVYYYFHPDSTWWFFAFHSKIQWFQQPVGIFVELAYAAVMSYIVATLIKRGSPVHERRSTRNSQKV